MMMSSLKYLSSTFLLMLTFAFASAQNTHVKLAHYDEDEIVKLMKETEAAERTLKSLSDQYEAEMEKMEGEYTRKAAEYQKEQASWDETIKRVRMEEIHTIKLKMQNYYVEGVTPPAVTQTAGICKNYLLNLIFIHFYNLRMHIYAFLLFSMHK